MVDFSMNFSVPVIIFKCTYTMPSLRGVCSLPFYLKSVLKRGKVDNVARGGAMKYEYFHVTAVIRSS